MGLIDGPWPRVPMTDGAGEVVAVGAAVPWSSWATVIGAFHPAWRDRRPGRHEAAGARRSSDGWLQQLVAFPAAAVMAPCRPTRRSRGGDAAVRRHHRLELAARDRSPARRHRRHPGHRRGVGARHPAGQGPRGPVIATSSSDDKLDRRPALGADHTVNYRTTPDWEKEVRTITGGAGADLVIDVAGPDTLGRSIGAVRMGGTVTVTGVLSGVGGAEISVSQVMTRNIRLVGVTTGSVADLDGWCRAVETNGIHPAISHVLEWEDVAEGARIMGAGEHLGKVVVRVP